MAINKKETVAVVHGRRKKITPEQRQQKRLIEQMKRMIRLNREISFEVAKRKRKTGIIVNET